jgi:hypothetical protein
VTPLAWLSGGILWVLVCMFLALFSISVQDEWPKTRAKVTYICLLLSFSWLPVVVLASLLT